MAKKINTAPMIPALTVTANYKAALENADGRLIGEYYTIGKHDIVTIVEAPNDEAMMSVLLAAGKFGNVRSETLKAFPLSDAETKLP